MARTQRAVIELRRRAVEYLAARGYSTREIEERFADTARRRPEDATKAGMVNPDTGKAWDHATVARDINALEKQWRKEAARERAEHKAQELAELREHRRAAWQAGVLSEVRLGLKAEMELLGTADIPGTADKPLVFKVIYGNDGTDDTSPEAAQEASGDSGEQGQA